MQCVGVKKDGVRCNVMVFGEAQHHRCGTHMATLNRVGPNQVRRDELKYAHCKNRREIQERFRPFLADRTLPLLERRRQQRLLQAAFREEDIRQALEVQTLEDAITADIDGNQGVDADEAIRQRVFLQNRERREARWERMEAQRLVWQQAIQPQAAPQQGELAVFANDRQNVHTAMVVQKVKDTVEKILQIPVPPEYQTDTLKTSGEIILECGLTKQSAWQMMSKYCADENIYDMGFGIYPRVLNSVWQFIKASPHAEDLKKILASEMTDNIGMCAQGNLSRLCNILAGYLEGINTDTKSKNEIIGERFAALLKLESHVEKVAEGVRILHEFDVPQAEHAAWLEPLIEA